MAIVINGSGTVTGLSVGGLPDGTVDSDTLASGIDKTSISDNGDATAITIDSSENVAIGHTSTTGSKFAICDGANSQIQFFPEISTDTNLTQHYDPTASAYINAETRAASHSFKIGTTDAMILNSDGDVLIGLTNDRTTTSTLYAYGNTSTPTGNCGLELAAAAAATRYLAAFSNSNGHVGSISTNGSATSFNTSSDYRLKENVVDMENATDRVKQLKPKRFNFIADDSITVDGFLAHEVQDIVPEAISGEKDAVDDDGNAVYQGIDQSKLVPLLVKTIQELEARITALEA